MAVYSKGKLVGIVGYKQLYPGRKMQALDSLLLGLPRIWAIKLVSNLQNKLVGKPFYNPNFRDENTTQIDVPRFFFGPKNLDYRQSGGQASDYSPQMIPHTYREYRNSKRWKI